MKIYHNLSELVGRTPLLECKNFSASLGLDTPLLAKLEYFNPAGSIKDRVALNIIEQAEKDNLLVPGSVIIEPTSGNTGIGIAAIAAAKGYKAIIVMPENMSEERKLLMKAYGAELVLTPAAQGMSGALAKADEIKAANPGSIIAGQFTNQANPQAHYRSTAPEIWEDTAGKVEVLIAGVGTGGTISGIGKYLKEKNPSIHIIAVEPANSPLLSQGKAGPHGLMGIGANFVPETLDQNIYDEIITVAEEDAYHYGRQFAAKEGILVGITSGAALSAAAEVAKRENFKGKNIVAILPDSGERYLSTPMFK